MPVKSVNKIVVLCLMCCVVGMSWSNHAQTKRRFGRESGNRKMIESVKTLAARLLDENATVENLLARAGRVAEKQTGIGYWITPADDKLYSRIWLGIEKDGEQRESPTYFELSLQPGASPPVADFDRAFGDRQRVPPLPRGRELHRVKYQYHPPGTAFESTVFVSFDAPLDDRQARATKIVIRRDGRADE